MTLMRAPAMEPLPGETFAQTTAPLQPPPTTPLLPRLMPTCPSCLFHAKARTPTWQIAGRRCLNVEMFKRWVCKYPCIYLRQRHFFLPFCSSVERISVNVACCMIGDHAEGFSEALLEYACLKCCSCLHSTALLWSLGLRGVCCKASVRL